MKRLISLLALLPLMLCSCSKENSSPNVDDTAVRFSTEITTRASGTTWDNGDAIGVFMLTAGQPLSGTNLADNVKYTNSASSFTSTTPIYYPQSGAVDFVAYYPYRTTPASDPYIYKVDVGVQTTPAAIDLLYSNNAANKSKNTTAVPLAFDHKMSRVVLNIKAGTGMTAANLTGITVKIAEMPTTADFNLATGTFGTPSTKADIVPIVATATSGFVATYTAIVVPQAKDVWGGRKMVFTVGTDVYEHLILEMYDFLSGKSYAYTVTVSKTGIEVSKGSITDWTGTDSSEDVVAEQIPIPQTVKIPAGIFMMGSSNGTNIGDGNSTGLNTTPKEPDRDTYETQHKVTLTKDFYMSKYEITNAQYAAFLNAKNIGSDGMGSVTYNKDGNPATETHDFIDDHSMGVQWISGDNKWLPATDKADFPVVNVNWYGAKAYADWVGGSLPTEAQWEYACRAGTATIYSYGNTADGDYMWYSGNNTPSGTKAVGRKLPNPWGLYDMHGNVWEWCSDYFDDYDTTNDTDPTGPNEVNNHVLRGGGWTNDAKYCRSAFRSSNYSGIESPHAGFRVVFVP